MGSDGAIAVSLLLLLLTVPAFVPDRDRETQGGSSSPGPKYHRFIGG